MTSTGKDYGAQAGSLVALDEYELRHLVVHLVEAARFEYLHRLLGLQTSAGQNSWFDAKQRARDSAGYASDVGMALLAVQQVASDISGTAPCSGFKRIVLNRAHENSFLAQLFRPDRIGAAEKRVEGDSPLT